MKTENEHIALESAEFDRLLGDFDRQVRAGRFEAGADVVEDKLSNMEEAAFAVAMLKLLWAAKKVGALNVAVRWRAVGYAKSLLAMRPDIPSAVAVVAEWDVN